MTIVVIVSPVLSCVVVGVREMHVGKVHDGEGEEEDEDLEEQEDEQDVAEEEEEEDVDEEEEDVDEEEAEYAFIASGLLAIVVISLPCTQCSMVYPSRTPSKAG